ncbi:MAG: hypothetical protein RLN69_04420 [Woeseiaceae bacterium]
MKRATIAAFACLLCSGTPYSVAHATDHDDLEVTMEVFDDLADVDRSVSALRRPRSKASGVVADEEGTTAVEQEMIIEPGSRDRFEHDDIDEDDRERALESEHEIEDGEEVDYDQYDIIDDMG